MARLKIAQVKEATSQEWDAAWEHCNYATYFQSRSWAEIWETYSGYMRPEPKLIGFSDGLKAVLPLSRVSGGPDDLIKSYVSSPAGTFGGWVSHDALTVEHARLLVHFMLNNLGDIVWLVNPYDENIFKAGIAPTDHQTHVLDLTPGFEALYKNFHEGNVRSIKKAQQRGVTVRAAEGIEEWREYYKVYEDSLDRWGSKATSRYSWKLFEEIHKRSANSCLWLATLEGQIISGAIFFYAKKHVVGWHGATLKDYFSYGPVNMLLSEVIRDAANNQYTWFDFNPSGGHEGVRAFKKSFDAKAVSCPLISARSENGLFIKKVVRKLKRQTKSILKSGVTYGNR
ncbi:MAG TPA: GNAT family N-acetyltransferase [Nitrospira sp.]|nr:GNAT family N-acetyltransferase [Nitrospira sp.]